LHRDRSGKISARELKQVFKALKINATDDEIKAVLKQMDRDSIFCLFIEINKIIAH
jgi:Ca2+-binding EF-hand superfamily protein